MRRVRPISSKASLRAGVRLGLLFLLACVLAACAELRALVPGGTGAATEAGEAAPEAPVEATPGIAYEVSLAGVPEEDLADLLMRASRLFALKDRPPPSLGALRRRAEGDLELLQTALRSEGFYAAEVRYSIDRGASPVAVTFEVSTGIQYLLADYEVRYEGATAPDEARRPDLDELGLHIGMAARAPAIVGAERALLDILGRRGFPLGKVLDRKTVVDHETTTMTVSLAVEAGPLARFGAVSVEGLDGVEEDYVRGFLAWTEGEIYDRDRVERTREALAATGLFASVAVVPGDAVGPQGRLPVTVRLSEAKHRSIGFGAGFSTSEGLGGEVFWEHRNLLGRNERLRLGLTAAEIKQSLEADFSKPRFLRPDQNLLAEAAATNSNTEAFDEQSVAASVGLERTFGKAWRASLGVSGEYSILTDEEGERTFRLFGLPVAGSRDTTDSLLDPTRGTRLNLSLTPYGGGDDETAVLFTVASAEGSVFYALDRKSRFVLAARGKIGTIGGEDTDAIPANKRFYAGGGGSIRGYEFQSVGPLDDEDEPLGGRSLLELNLEARIRLTESFGLVPFIDGGTVFDSPYPDFEETLRWAGGLGARYFTDFGPLRVDIAVPINRRDVDDRFQFYISLGQAF